jgi:sulfatase maturation enzyme AslB (radical SAM superfamily)
MDAPDGDFAASAKQLREVGRERLSIEERKRRRRALDSLGIESFASHLHSRGLPAPVKASPTTLQVNVGLYCNQACNHCHVESSPRRTETMSSETVAQILRVLDASPNVATVDITGGAPEMHDAFRPLVEGEGLRISLL